jgi:Putative zinc-finger
MTEHREMSELIPWYVNDTLEGAQRKSLETHMAGCALCRSDLELERSVYRTMTRDTGVEHMPAASLKRLQARLDALQDGDAEAGAASGDVAQPTGERPAGIPRRAGPWRVLAAASAACVAVALGAFVLARRPDVVPQTYRTVTTASARVPGEVIRAVFKPSITLTELQALLDESHMRIVAGPTEAGVYSLASSSTLPVSASLEMLRKHDTVRFAESTVTP